jgi:hypothetical protein
MTETTEPPDPDPGCDRLPTGDAGLHALLLVLIDRISPGSSATAVPAGPARETLAILTDRIRNPLQVIRARADLMGDEATAGKICEQVLRINQVLKRLEDDLEEPRRQSRNRIRSRRRRRY